MVPEGAHSEVFKDLGWSGEIDIWNGVDAAHLTAWSLLSWLKSKTGEKNIALKTIPFDNSFTFQKTKS